MVWLAFIFILLLIICGLPLFAGMGLLAILFTYFNEGKDSLINLFIDPLGRLTQSDMLLPIPLFTLMGYLISRSGAPERIVNLFQFLIQKVVGKAAFSVGVMAVIVSAFFTPFTGASGVTIIALGGILMPVLKRVNLSDKLSLGIITSSGSLGLLFFPSVPVILYGIVSNNKVSIADLFKAGILPGILLILLPSIYVFFAARNVSAPDMNIKPDYIRENIWKLTSEILILPVLFFLFMSGKITVAEIGLIGLIYFFILEVILFKEVPFNKLSEITMESMSVIGGILIITFFATAFTSFMIDYQTPQKLFIWIQKYISSKWTFLLLLNIFLLLVGALMDEFSAIIVVAPLIIPIAELYGVNMVHLGILFLTNLEIGYIAPPVGMNLFLAAFRFKISMTQVIHAVLPFLYVFIVNQIMITYIPEISLWFIH